MTELVWITHDGGNNPVREGETLVGYRLRDGYNSIGDDVIFGVYDWRHDGTARDITHYAVTPPRDAAPVTEPAPMSADEVLIRAREAVIEVYRWGGMSTQEIEDIRAARRDEFVSIKAVLAYERNRAKPLAEVAPHTVEDADERVAYEVYVAMMTTTYPFVERHKSLHYRCTLAAIKRGRELERGA